MKINTQIMVTVTRDDGREVVLSRSIVSRAGDNPSFERREVYNSILFATDDFIEANALIGKKPL